MLREGKMLAEIFMVWLGMLRRMQTSGVVETSSAFVPFDRRSFGSFKVSHHRRKKPRPAMPVGLVV